MLYFGKTVEEMKQESKESNIRYYKSLAKAFEINPTMEASSIMSDMADILVKMFGLTWDDIEMLETEAYAEA